MNGPWLVRIHWPSKQDLSFRWLGFNKRYPIFRLAEGVDFKLKSRKHSFLLEFVDPVAKQSKKRYLSKVKHIEPSKRRWKKDKIMEKGCEVQTSKL